ncbi:MAG: alternative ribosome rescue aminoacyl-tRNA hydrolase ArfB [Chloroflexi bacterium]|nr:alternative ribosome rescue aminoacyl-tRNA hydrolase ArfB [Chloroflexota bacterium]
MQKFDEGQADANDDLIINAHVRIPLSTLHVQFTRSAGAGGQHVNKTETAVEISFDLQHTPCLSEVERARALSKLRSHVTAEGILRVESRDSRSQLQNREDATQRFVELLRQALVVPRARRKTKPTRSAVEGRLRTKKSHSASKQIRRSRPDAE